MRRSRFAGFAGRVLMAAGLGAGILGILMWNFDFRIHVPQWMWRVAAVKLTFAAAVGLVAAGALLLRHLKRREQIETSPASGPPDESPRQLGAVSWTPDLRQREQEPQRITTPPEPHTP